MTGDFFTKPNQGSLFWKFRDMIMGVVVQPDPGPGKSKRKKEVTRKYKYVQAMHGSCSMDTGVCWRYDIPRILGEQGRTTDGRPCIWQPLIDAQ